MERPTKSVLTIMLPPISRMDWRLKLAQNEEFSDDFDISYISCSQTNVQCFQGKSML